MDASNVLILTPTGDDPAVTRQVLAAAGIEAVVCENMEQLSVSVVDAGVLLIAEEAFDGDGASTLFGALELQPSWSDVPVIVLTREKALSTALPAQIAALSNRANVTLLERPVRVATLMTMVQSALRARRRQRELRSALDSARAARREAEAANEAKSKFLSTMSHELRTPLNAIAGYAQLLELEIGGPLTEAQRKHLGGIIKSESHLLALINDVLDFAKIEAGVIELSQQSVDTAVLIQDLETFVRPQLDARQLAFEIGSFSCSHVEADEEKLRQILLNLLSNAIKFCRFGGAIRIYCESVDDEVHISVADEGEGIAPDKLESIFAPFVQVGRTFSSPMEGTGLGLSISRELARRMGGDLRVVSKLGEGSTFTVVLPARPARSAQSAD